MSAIGRQAGKGLGADLLVDALRRIALASRSIGAVPVQARKGAAERFPLGFGEFVGSPQDSRMPSLPIETTAAFVRQIPGCRPLDRCRLT